MLFPERISVPPPPRLRAWLPPVWPIAPLTQSVLPPAAVTFKLLPSVIGAAIVRLPPLELMVAARPVFDRLDTLPLLAPGHVAAGSRGVEAEAAEAAVASSGHVGRAAGATVPKTAVSWGLPRGRCRPTSCPPCSTSPPLTPHCPLVRGVVTTRSITLLVLLRENVDVSPAGSEKPRLKLPFPPPLKEP